MSAPKQPTTLASQTQEAQAAIAQALVDAEENPRDETVPGGRYLVDDGRDASGKRLFRAVNAYAGEYKEGQDPDEMRAKHERTTGLF